MKDGVVFEVYTGGVGEWGSGGVGVMDLRNSMHPGDYFVDKFSR